MFRTIFYCKFNSYKKNFLFLEYFKVRFMLKSGINPQLQFVFYPDQIERQFLFYIYGYRLTSHFNPQLMTIR